MRKIFQCFAGLENLHTKGEGVRLSQQLIDLEPSCHQKGFPAPCPILPTDLPPVRDLWDSSHIASSLRSCLGPLTRQISPSPDLPGAFHPF